MKNRKLIWICLLFSCALLWRSSNVQAAEEIVISTEQELMAFIMGEYGTCDEKMIYLENDIKITDNSIETWADATWTFSGTFDGGGNTISNLHRCTLMDSGLFRKAEGATIKNVIIEDSSFTSTGYNAGGIVGYAEEGTRIINCHVKNCEIIGEETTGGVVGLIQGSDSAVINCSFSGNGTVQDYDENDDYVGGIAGASACASVSNCANYCVVEGSGVHVGGITGESSGYKENKRGLIQNCINIGQVSGGGIAGKLRGQADIFNVYCLSGTAESLILYDEAEEEPSDDYIPFRQNMKMCTQSEMTADDFLDQLNADVSLQEQWKPWQFTEDSIYPVLEKPIPISRCQITISQDYFVYDGTAKHPVVTVMDGEKGLVQDVDYTLEEWGSTEPGEWTRTVYGKGKYAGIAQFSYTIDKAQEEIFCEDTITFYKKKNSMINLGERIQHKGDGALEYRLSNNDVVKVYTDGSADVKGYGTVTVTIMARENHHYYGAVKNITLRILEPTTTVSNDTKSSQTTVKVAKQKITKAVRKGNKSVVKWKKNKNVNGYEVEYSTRKNFAVLEEDKTISNAETNIYETSALKKNKTYYFRVRSYKKVGGKTYYGEWSDAATIKKTAKGKKKTSTNSKKTIHLTFQKLDLKPLKKVAKQLGIKEKKSVRYPGFYAKGKKVTFGINYDADWPDLYEYVENNGNKRVKLLGIRIGMTRAQAVKALTSQGVKMNWYKLSATRYSYGDGLRVSLKVKNGKVVGYTYACGPTG